jgi:capsular exopolysaccharide synthesis family protein
LSNYDVPQARNEASIDPSGPSVLHSSEASYGLRNFLRILARRRKWIIGPIVVCLILAVIVSLIMRATYRSTATIELNKSNNGGMDLGMGDVLGQQFGDEESLQTDLATETAILQSDSLALAVIRKLNLTTQPPFFDKDASASERGKDWEQSPEARTRLLKIFSSHLTVETVRGTRLIRVSFQSHDANQAAQIGNAIIDSYKSQYLQSHYEASSEASDWMTTQLSELKANVEDSEKKLTDFEKASGILSFQTATFGNGNESGGGGGGEQIHSTVLQKLDELNTELTMAEGNRIQKEAIYRIARAGNGEEIVALGNSPLATQGNSMVVTQGGGVSNLQVLQQKQNDLKLSLADAATMFGANNRHLKEIETQISELDKQIQQEIQEIIKRARTDMELAQQTEDGVRHQFEKQQEEASKLNEKTVEFAVLSQEATSRKRLYEDLYTKLQEANVSAGIKATNITVVDPARPQSIPVRPDPVFNGLLALLGGIFIGLAAAFAVDSVDRTVVNPLEVEEITRIPVIGIIPTFGDSSKGYGSYGSYGARPAYGISRRREKGKSAGEEAAVPEPIWILNHPESVAAEAFRSLRTSILLSRSKAEPKVILVTSCIPGEGKSTLTANLAISFAQHGKKVLIVEADMRRPSMKHVLDVSNETGLSNVLTGSLSLDEATLHGVHVPTLDVLPAGPRPPMPSEILGSPAFDNLLEQLRARYDVVLIDSPPALLLTDAVSIASKTDAAVWVARAGVITRPYLARAAQLIERNGMPVIGFVLNRMEKSVDPYGYGYGYGYEYKKYGAYYGEKNSNDA